MEEFVNWLVRLTEPIHQNQPIALLLLLIIIAENIGLVFILRSMYKSVEDSKKTQMLIIESMSKKSDVITNRLFELIEKFHGNN